MYTLVVRFTLFVEVEDYSPPESVRWSPYWEITYECHFGFPSNFPREEEEKILIGRLLSYRAHARMDAMRKFPGLRTRVTGREDTFEVRVASGVRLPLGSLSLASH